MIRPPLGPGARFRLGSPWTALALALALALPAVVVRQSVENERPTTAAGFSTTDVARAEQLGNRPSAPAPTSTGAVSSRPSVTPESGGVSGPAAAVAAVEQPRTRSTRVTQQRRSLCGGGLAFGTVRTCRLISPDQTHSWTLTTTAPYEQLFVQVVEEPGVELAVQMRTGAGAKVCDLDPDKEYVEPCQLVEGGTYTLAVTAVNGGSGAYTVSVESRKTPSSCSPLPEDAFSWASAGVAGSLPAGLAARCYTLDQPVDTRLFIAAPHLRDGSHLRAVIIDARGLGWCSSPADGSDCVLDGRGPYRLFVQHVDGQAATYALRLPRISHPVGCAALMPAPGGEPGTVSGGGNLRPSQRACHSFSVAAPGTVSVEFSQSAWSWRLYDEAGTLVCSSGAFSPGSCTLTAAGRYAVVPWSGYGPTAQDYEVAVTPVNG